MISILLVIYGQDNEFSKKTNLKPLLDEISRDMMARNMLGCHANEWAQSMSESEILSFARNLRLLYENLLP